MEAGLPVSLFYESSGSPRILRMLCRASFLSTELSLLSPFASQFHCPWRPLGVGVLSESREEKLSTSCELRLWVLSGFWAAARV